MSLVVDEHREYLADGVRLGAYASAIQRTVRPGDVVIDLGAGTGILGLLACRAGAAHVYAIEASGLIDIARAIAAENGYADRITWIHKPVHEAELPERADVLLGDFAGRMGFEAGVFDLYARARRWLKRGAHAVPSAVTIYAAPVEDEAAHRHAAFWAAPIAGFSLTPALRWSFNTGYPTRFVPSQLLGADVRGTFDTLSDPELLRVRGRSEASRAGVMHGLAAWFSAALAPDVEMTNAPHAAARIARRNVFLPLEAPVRVEAGSPIDIDIRIRPADMLVNWKVAGESHSTLHGMLISRDALRAQDPAARPRLTARGEARRALLDLCDGGRSLREIEREVFERHRALFASPAEAQAFVAEVVTLYGEFD